MTKLSEIQQKLKAPKGQFNKFGGYSYRSCEDILEAVKPLLGGASLVLSDEVLEIGGRVYVRATAALYDEKSSQVGKAVGWAREAETKKGMDESQITGSASSYARKYALNGLFCIDDTKDADATNDHGKAQVPEDPVAAARNRLVAAVNVYAVKRNADKKAVMEGIKKRPDFKQTVEFFNSVAEEFENEVK